MRHAANQLLSGRLLGVLITLASLGAAPLSAGTPQPSGPEPAPGGWQFMYANTAAGGRIDGDKQALLDAARLGRTIGVRWLTFHGELSAVCKSVTTDLDGRLECQVDMLCTQGGDGIPSDHRHQARVTTGGEISSLVLVPKGPKEQRLVAVGEGSSSVCWYAYGEAVVEHVSSSRLSMASTAGR